eukprot:3162260-Prymnesium_polylepis.1
MELPIMDTRPLMILNAAPSTPVSALTISLPLSMAILPPPIQNSPPDLWAEEFTIKSRSQSEGAPPPSLPRHR